MESRRKDEVVKFERVYLNFKTTSLKKKRAEEIFNCINENVEHKKGQLFVTY